MAEKDRSSSLFPGLTTQLQKMSSIDRQNREHEAKEALKREAARIQREVDHNLLLNNPVTELLKQAARVLSTRYRTELSITKLVDENEKPLDVRLIWDIDSHEVGPSDEDGYRLSEYNFNEVNIALLKNEEGEHVGYRINRWNESEDYRGTHGSSRGVVDIKGKSKQKLAVVIDQAIMNPVRKYNMSSPYTNSYRDDIDFSEKKQTRKSRRVPNNGE